MRFVFLLLLFPLLVSAQLTDDFSDGNLQNPDWQGDLPLFGVENETLRLADAAALQSTSRLYLAAPTSLQDATVWEGWVQFDFAASTTNYPEVMLTTAPPVPGEVPTGYGLRFGGVSGSDDALVLYRLGDFANPIVSGTAGALGTDGFTVRFRLTRSTDGTWNLAADYSGGTDLVDQGSGQDATHDQLGFYVFQARYTATRSEAFAFDDLLVDPLFEDTTAPQLLSAAAISATQISLRFNELLDPASVTDPGQYQLSPAGPAITAAAPDPTDGTRVILTLAGELTPLTLYTVSVTGPADAAGNALAGTATTTFTFRPVRAPLPGELIVTEFMADPTPTVNLPDAEYVELYNRGDVSLQLQGVGLASGGSPQFLPAYILDPGAYVLVVDDSDLADFQALGPAIAVTSFASLSNAADEISLEINGQRDFFIAYTDKWYKDDARSEGGYSLELSDLNPPYNCAGKWGASRAAAGGTPGAANSLAGLVLDTVPPTLIRSFFAGSTLVLEFDEQLDRAAAEMVGNYFIGPDLNLTAAVLQSDERTVILQLDAPPAPGQVYELNVFEEVADCVGNRLPEFIGRNVGLPQEVAVGDVVINEILFNPGTGGVDFVELFNCSNKIFNVRGWRLLNDQQTSGGIEERIGSDYLFFPGAYLVITPDVDDILGRYPAASREQLLENRLPTLPDDAGNVTLLDAVGTQLDAFDYREEQHNPLLDDLNGVSLERLLSKSPTQQDANWYSASSAAGFATPTLPNSQARDRLPVFAGDEFFSVADNTFSPDGDGVQDILAIDYQTPAPGWAARLEIYDAQGRLTRTFLRTELLGGSGTLLWNGVNDDGERARVGPYVILIERFSPQGDTEREKIVVVLAGQL